MKVLKFGGTSVGSAQRMKDVAKLICDGRAKDCCFVCYVRYNKYACRNFGLFIQKKSWMPGANEIINGIEHKYMQVIDELYSTDEYKQRATEIVKSHFDYIRSFTKDLFTLFEEKVILAQGELDVTAMVNLYLNETGVKSVLIPALDYMQDR